MQTAVPTSLYSIIANFLLPIVLLVGSYMFFGGTILPEQLVAFMIMSVALSALLIAFEHSYNMLKDLKLAAVNLERAYDTKPLPYKEEQVVLKNFHYISEVFQENTLLSVTIYNNIKAGRRQDATEEDVYAAAKAARCHEFIEKLPEGYQTQLSEGGGTLSGGEKQRVAIARAILKNAPIVLLDEPTASQSVFTKS